VNLHLLTIVLDGFPFLLAQLATFNRLKTSWRWSIVEGQAASVKDTSWTKPQSPRLSRDGTTALLNSLRSHPRIHVYQQQLWPGKTAMCNAALEKIKEPCTLMQIDCDELWEPWQLEWIVKFFEDNPVHNCARFYCRYFIGPNIVVTSEDTWGNRPSEWLRAWRFEPGNRMITHEPPKLSGSAREHCLPRHRARIEGVVFDHMAYLLPEQVAFKQAFYGYDRALEHWQRLQRNTNWPVKLRKFLPWVDENATADLLYKP
jgi:hypothetical protein